MFFENKSFAISDISVFITSWKEISKPAAPRNYNALSFRAMGNATFRDHKGQTKAGTGDLVFVPANCGYHIEAEPEKLVVIRFTSNLALSDGIKKFSPKNPEQYHNLFLKIREAFERKDTGYEFECKAILYKILSQIEKDFGKQAVPRRNQTIQKVIKYIHDNFTSEELSVEGLAKMHGMSETYLRKKFAEVCDCAPCEYISRLRLDYAATLLSTKYYTVGEVAYKCGFSSLYYFSAFIKRRTGHSPSHFMK